jgi:CBS domain-containing protein
MDDVFVGSLMSSPVATVEVGESLRTAGQTMLDHDIGSVIVTSDTNQLEGILTRTDFVRIIAEEDPDPDATVDAFMSTDVTTTTVNDSIQDVADTMVERGIHHVPVVDGRDVIGIITTADLALHLSGYEESSSV